MGDLLDLSARIIDSGVADQPVNRVTNELTELADDLAIVESFSHSIVWDSGDGLVAFDASAAHTGAAVVEAIRGWRTAPIRHLVYTHGHADHVGGSVHMAAAAERDGHARPNVIGHEAVEARLARYEYTNDWNVLINARQFGGVRSEMSPVGTAGTIGATSAGDRSGVRRFLPAGTLHLDDAIGDEAVRTIGGETVELHHARAETDDHLWAWFPNRKWIMTGDFVIWNFPNAGNPQKVQRYPIEWAAALRRMIAQGPELLLPAHGLPIAGRERIAGVLDDIATALERLVDAVIAMMNDGATLDTIVHAVSVPAETLGKPYLRPLYDEPEFVVRNIWRQFGGWWDGAASRLKPSPDAQVASVLADLAGGADVLLRRAETAAADGDLRLACHLADLAGWAAPDDAAIHGGRAAIYMQRRAVEPSLMSKGIFRAAARESEIVAERGRTDG